MIISASRRTDIPAFYADWFFNRLQEGYVLTRNPINPHQVSRICLSADTVDGIVFWTKNPLPIADRLNRIETIPYYFQFTLTSYGQDLEPGVPAKDTVMIPAFRALAKTIGPERLVWRYDPIILTPTYTVAHHLDTFRRMAEQLSGCSDSCVISFYDDYRHLRPAVQALGLRPPTTSEMLLLAEAMAEIARRYGFRLMTCTEAIDLSSYGIDHGQCIDADRLGRIGGVSLRAARDPNQRAGCGCAASIDIGMYDSCGNGCRYCYANHASAAVRAHRSSHNPASPLLYGTLADQDQIRDRAMPSLRSDQLSFLE